MIKPRDEQTDMPPSGERVTEFEIDSGGTLRMAGYQEAETRAEFYEDVASLWSASPQALADAMEACQPLAWEVYSLYTDFRDVLAADVLDAQEAGASHKKRLTALQTRLRTMPGEPEDNGAAWLLSLSSREFEEWVCPVIEEWFEAAPNWNFEDDYLPEVGTAQGAALEFFREIEGTTLDLLGIEIVEGDRPGSSYYAAEMIGDVDNANAVAAKHSIPLRFIRVDSVKGLGS